MRCGAEPEKNLACAIEFIRDAARQGAEIVCLPELFRSQYFCQTEDHKNFDLAEEVPGKSTAALGEVARETGTLIIASLFERRSAGLYHNTAAIIDADGKLLGKYRKMHIPDDPLYHVQAILRIANAHADSDEAYKNLPSGHCYTRACRGVA